MGTPVSLCLPSELLRSRVSIDESVRGLPTPPHALLSCRVPLSPEITASHHNNCSVTAGRAWLASTSHLQDQWWKQTHQDPSQTGLACILARPLANSGIPARTPHSSVLARAGRGEDFLRRVSLWPAGRPQVHILVFCCCCNKSPQI